MTARKRTARKTAARKNAASKTKRRYSAAACDLLIEASDDELTYTSSMYSRSGIGVDARIFSSEEDAVKHHVGEDEDEQNFVIYEIIPIARHSRPKETVRTPL